VIEGLQVMKIVFFRHSLLSRGGDKMIALHAAHLARCGHDVTIMADIVSSVFPLDDRITLKPMPYHGKAGTLVSAVIASFDADLIIADIIPLAVLLAVRHRDKVVYFAQDYDETYYKSSLMRFLIRQFYVIGLKWMRISIIAVAKHLAHTFQQRFGVKSIVIENGVDSSVFFREPDEQLIGCKQQRNAVLVLSRHDPRKGFDVALEALALLPEGVKATMEVWTVGENTGRRIAHIMQHRHFGYVGEARLRQLLSSADLFFYPTRHEGFPLMVVEAFACGCPVLTTDAVTYAQHGHNALVGRIGDTTGLSFLLMELLQDDLRRLSLAAHGIEFASHYTLRRSLEGFASVMQQLGPGHSEQTC
jgi:glycosyltransferase involved in cell wall biosynthesis